MNDLELKMAWAEWREENKYQMFCHWLKGFFDLQYDKTAPITQWQKETIQSHLDLVFGTPMIHRPPPHPEMPPLPHYPQSF